jgi:hypothetical protein
VGAVIRSPALYAAIAGAAIAAVAVLLFTGSLDGEDDHDGAKSVAKRPIEFVFLDEPRVRAYLSQIDRGAATQVTRVESLTRSLGGKAKAGSVLELDASAQDTRSEQTVLTPTGVSAFAQLEQQLELTDLNLNDPVTLHNQHDALKEGRLVRMKSRQLLFPHYIAPYVVVRQFATLNALFPRRRRAQRKAALRFARQVGPNPRVTLAVQARVGQALVRYLLPLEYLGLSNERSLLAGGTVTIVGKVVRLFRLRSFDLNDKRAGRPAYRDLATRETWREPVRGMPGSLYDRISTSRRMVRECRERSLGRARNCLRRALNRQTTVPGPGAVILPLAIYK